MGRWQLVLFRRSDFDLNTPINTQLLCSVQFALCTDICHLTSWILNCLIWNFVLLFFSFLDPTTSNEQLYICCTFMNKNTPPPSAITSSLKRKSVKEQKSCSTMNLLRACVELIYEYWIEWIPCHMVPCPRGIIRVFIYIHHKTIFLILLNLIFFRNINKKSKFSSCIIIDNVLEKTYLELPLI